jgi:hypothetical protein
MTLVLDAGAFIAVERADRDTVALLKRELAAGRVPVTHGGVVGQVWRGGSGKQANLARLLRGSDIVPLDDAFGRRAGLLLALSNTSDVIDAAVVLLAKDGDTIITSDTDDLEPLAVAAGLQVDLVAV